MEDEQEEVDLRLIWRREAKYRCATKVYEASNWAGEFDRELRLRLPIPNDRHLHTAAASRSSSPHTDLCDGLRLTGCRLLRNVDVLIVSAREGERGWRTLRTRGDGDRLDDRSGRRHRRDLLPDARPRAAGERRSNGSFGTYRPCSRRSGFHGSPDCCLRTIIRMPWSKPSARRSRCTPNC